MTKSLSLRLWFGLFVIVVFGAGVGAGLMLAPLRPPRPLTAAFEPAPMPGDRGILPRQPGMGSLQLVPQLAGALGLSDEQERQLDDVFARRRLRLESIQRDVRGRFEEEQREMREEIRTILTAEQWATFREWLRRPLGHNQRRPPRP